MSATLAGGVVGGVLGGVVITMIVTVVWWIYRRRRLHGHGKSEPKVFYGLTPGDHNNIAPAGVPDVIPMSLTVEGTSSNDYQVISDTPQNCLAKSPYGPSISNSDQTEFDSQGDYIEIKYEDLETTGIYSLATGFPKDRSPENQTGESQDTYNRLGAVHFEVSFGNQDTRTYNRICVGKDQQDHDSEGTYNKLVMAKADPSGAMLDTYNIIDSTESKYSSCPSDKMFRQDLNTPTYFVLEKTDIHEGCDTYNRLWDVNPVAACQNLKNMYSRIGDSEHESSRPEQPSAEYVVLENVASQG